MWVWVWMADFFVFKSLNSSIVYTSGIDVYVCKRNRCTTKVLWVLKFWQVGAQDFFFKIKAGRTVFNFSCKTSFFCSRYVFFLSKGREFVLKNHSRYDVIFFVQNFFFFWAGRCSFWVKKRQFIEIFLRKTENSCPTWMVWVNKRQFFEISLKVPSLARSVSKPLKVSSLSSSVLKPLKVPSLARSVFKPRVGETGGYQTRHYHRCRPPTSWSAARYEYRLSKVNCESESEKVKVKVKKSDSFVVLYFSWN